jgi:hypothetical protein
VAAVVDTLSIGRLTLTRVAARIARGASAGAPVKVGLDLLLPFTPTIDGGRRTLTLRATRRTPVVLPSGARLPLRLTPRGIVVLAGSRWVSLDAAELRAIRASALTIDSRRGEIVSSR